MRKALSIAALGLTACLPIPHTVRLAPEIEGTVLAGDRPMIAAPVGVTFSWDSLATCQPEHETLTDSTGHFRLPGRKQREWVVWLLMAHYAADWRVCAREAEGWRPIFQASSYSPGNAPRRQVILCQLADSARGIATTSTGFPCTLQVTE